MQPIPDELLKAISQRLKAGENAKPVYRVEVDKMVFIPGRTQEVEFLINDYGITKELLDSWIESVDGAYSGESYVNSSNLMFPVPGRSMADITSKFGQRGSEFHTGIDIAADVGEDAAAAFGGKVTNVVRNLYKSYGNYVDIVYRGDILMRYAHLNDILVYAGQEVEKGQIIAKAGNTGNVRHGGKAVTGSYSDPDSERSRGLGAHLHFEIRIKDSKGNFTPVDPLKYLNGSNSIYVSSTNAGEGVSTGDSISGVPGEVRLRENFLTRDWYFDKREYAVDSNFHDFACADTSYDVGYNSRALKFIFDPKKTSGNVTVGFDISITMNKAGFMDIGYIGNMLSGGEFRIYSNGKLIRRVVKFKNKAHEELKDVVVPAGDNHIRIEVTWVRGSQISSFYITNILIQELNPEPRLSGKNMPNIDPTADTPESVLSSNNFDTASLEDLVFNEKPQKTQLQVGQFSYLETLVLDNVQNIEIDDQYDAECREASITITDPDGFYSPDYNPYFFPELYEKSPWSDYVNGVHIGVLSENTPIRIFLGYGQNLVRVFTGLIDKVEVAGDMMTITCRDMYKKIQNKVLTETKMYPETVSYTSAAEKAAWLKSAVIQDLAEYAGLFGWRVSADDMYYPDAVIEETYLIEVDQKTGMVVRAVPDKEGEFITEPISSVPTPQGWLNPFVEEYGKRFDAYKYKVNDCINEVMQDTDYRSYCDRYGTYRFEQIDLDRPVAGEFDEHKNMLSISKNMDFANARSHLVIFDNEGKFENFIDKEILMELKGELRTAVIEVPWAKSSEAKKQAAEKVFFDMKRLARTLQVSIIGNPSFDVLDRIFVRDKSTSTFSAYTIKGIRHSFSKDDGYIQILDLMWSEDGTVV